MELEAFGDANGGGALGIVLHAVRANLHQSRAAEPLLFFYALLALSLRGHEAGRPLLVGCGRACVELTASQQRGGRAGPHLAHS